MQYFKSLISWIKMLRIQISITLDFDRAESLNPKDYNWSLGKLEYMFAPYDILKLPHG